MKIWVVGIDFSMTCPAITIINRNGLFQFERCQFYYLSSKVENISFPNIHSTRLPEYSSNAERFDIISDWGFNSICNVVGSDKVELYIEGYAMRGKGRLFEIGENTGMLKYKLWKHKDWHPIPIPPTVVKKYATGKGNAQKNQLYDAFVKRTGVRLMEYYQPKAKEVGSPVGDLVDSFYIALCGWDGVGIG